jgi:hypothetical protein
VLQKVCFTTVKGRKRIAMLLQRNYAW